MTKKYWADWQKRIGETKNICLFLKHYNYCKGNKIFAYYGKKWSGILNDYYGEKILKAEFHGDAVDLIIERHNTVIDWNTRSLKQHIENEYLTLHREEIANIEFIKY
jgi:hypothetical protein